LQKRGKKNVKKEKNLTNVKDIIEIKYPMLALAQIEL
jgi:hypothetical protein